MQCKDVELVLEQEGIEPLPEEARAHLAECRDCRNYVSDLTSLVDAANKLPAEIAPPDRVWISLRAQLEEEGIIRTPADLIPAEPVSWWQSIHAFFSNRILGHGHGCHSSCGRNRFPDSGRQIHACRAAGADRRKSERRTSW